MKGEQRLVWSQIRTEPVCLEQSLEAGQCKAIWSKNHPWGEEGEGLEPLPLPCQDLPCRGCAAPCSAELRQQLITARAGGARQGPQTAKQPVMDELRARRHS